MKDTLLSVIVRLLVGAVALWITSLLAQSLQIPLKVGSASGAVVAVVALSLANALIRPVLNLLAMPLRCMTFGLIGFAINALLFWGVSLLKIEGFQVGGNSALGTVEAAFFGSIVMSVVSALLNAFVKVKQ